MVEDLGENSQFCINVKSAKLDKQSDQHNSVVITNKCPSGTYFTIETNYRGKNAKKYLIKK